VVGSANASANSTLLDEAVLVTDEVAVIEAVRAFVLGLATADRRMDQDDLDRAAAIYRASPGRGAPPGTDAGGEHRPVRPFPSATSPRFYIADGDRGAATAGARRVAAQTRRAVRIHAGPAREFSIEPISTEVGDEWNWKPDDLLVWVDAPDPDGDADVWLSEVEAVHGVNARERLYWVRTPSAQQPRRLSEIYRALKALGYRSGLGELNRWVRSPKLRDDLLTFWL
jgi:hypothetical protein